ncbi:TauD/TfdA family dioxygenase [Streptomyces sp. 796.1]|uniref:TauD/TfdA family dioxygenase n=1 Tax=Streptomyces sp. 796.1 TaxID=3163029 RepID=UPI0039C8FF0C
MTATPAPGPLHRRRPVAAPCSMSAPTPPSAVPAGSAPAAEPAPSQVTHQAAEQPSTARPPFPQPAAPHAAPDRSAPAQPASRPAAPDQRASRPSAPEPPVPVPAAGDAVPAAAPAPAGAGPVPRPPLPDEDPQYYLEQGARLLRGRLSATALAELERWRSAPTPWLELDGLPQTVTEVPTPRDGFCDESLLTVPNLVHFGLLRLLGLEPVAFRWENHGRLLRNVAPSAGAARSQTSWGYATELDWHTDDSVLDHAPGGTPGESIPHFLTFYGMRNTERVPTWLLPVDEVLAGLPLATISALHQPDFDVSAPESYASYGTGPEAGAGAAADARAGTGADAGTGAGAFPPGRPPLRTGVPLLWTLPDGGTGLRYGPGRVSGRTPAARAALDRFVARVAGCEGVPVLVEAGGFHLFDNRRVMHRRLPFEPAAADRARWLRRCYARRSTA